MQLDVGEIVRTVQHPHVVVLVHRQASDAADLPLVWQRLRPIRIELVAWRRRRLRRNADTQGQQAKADRNGELPGPCARINMVAHRVLPDIKMTSLMLHQPLDREVTE
jgi:hypothetical protein